MKLDNPSSAQSFLERIHALEEQLFADELDPADPTRMKSDAYSWLYRPSHHVKTGLITEQDVSELMQGKRLLSIGAFPAHLERTLVSYGVPAENIVIADSNPAIFESSYPMDVLQFDCTKEWPDIGMFDIIIFPESLCIALTDTLKQETVSSDDVSHPTDAREAVLLHHVMEEALSRLTSDGVIRANGPMSHPNVWKIAGAALDRSGYPHTLNYQRYFITVRHG